MKKNKEIIRKIHEYHDDDYLKFLLELQKSDHISLYNNEIYNQNIQLKPKTIDKTETIKKSVIFQDQVIDVKENKNLPKKYSTYIYRISNKDPLNEKSKLNNRPIAIIEKKMKLKKKFY